jgi:predicted transposase YbfD/YdcC
LDEKNQSKNMKNFSTAILVLVIFIGFTSGTSVPCTGFARALEVDEENVLTADPCGGRVCQETCSCGQTVYFNVEGLISSGGSGAYSDVCVTEKASRAPPDENFVFNQLKASLLACGYKDYKNVNNFVSLSETVGRLSYNVGNRGMQGTRKAYPPVALLNFALSLKSFAKVCRDTGDWENNLHARLDAKENEAKNNAAKERSPTCVYQQLMNIKNNFAQSVVDSKRVYCHCSRLIGYKKVVSNNNRGMTTTTTYPYKTYQKNIDAECKRKCSGTVVLEYEE